MKLDIISDPICPWCHIGKSFLDKAIAQRPNHPFKIEWHPFQLNPEMPPEGMDRKFYLESKFGGQLKAVQAYLPVTEWAEKAGLELNLESIARTPNTLDAHRLIHWAGIEGLQIEVVSKLFTSYFTDGLDLGKHSVLANVASSVGMNRQMVLNLLESDADIKDIQARDGQFRNMGISGVPCFIVDGRHVVQGSQPSELWLNVIDEVMEKLANPESSEAVNQNKHH